ncbi:MAG: CvpA family protein [Muribaculaceae bacterium]|nr:CvpA family protein [Muribaculaceae bacterium]
MADLLYHLVIITALALGTIKGFRERITSQTPSCFGIAFGVLCSYIFRFPAEEIVSSFLKSELTGVDGEFVLSNLSCTLIFIIAYTIFYLCTYVLKLFFRMIDTGMLDNIAGAIFGAFRGAFFISIALNLWLAVSPDSCLLKYAMHDDGDIVHEVMLLSPFMLGSESVDELAHKIQLEEAKYIS